MLTPWKLNTRNKLKITLMILKKYGFSWLYIINYYYGKLA